MVRRTVVPVMCHQRLLRDSVLDGDLTSNIKYSLEKTVNTQAAGEYPIEFRVMDRGGNTVYLKTQISISDKSYAGIDVKLKRLSDLPFCRRCI